MIDRDGLIALCYLLDTFLQDDDYFDPDDPPETIAEVFEMLDDERVLRPSTIPDEYQGMRVVRVRCSCHKEDVR